MSFLHPDAVAAALQDSVRAALGCIGGKSPISDDDAHEARKQLKRARAALRLLKPSLEDVIYRHENLALRNASRVISPLRDAKAQLDILAALRKRYPATLPSNELAPLCRNLRHRLEDTHQRIRPDSPAVRETIRTLKDSRRRLRKFHAQQASAGQLKKGLRKVYERAQSAYEAAKADPTPASMHEWRKKTKYLYNAVKLLDPPKSSRPAVASKRAQRLGEWLGEEHDLVVLSGVIDSDTGLTLPSAARGLKVVIDDRYAKLCAKALRLGAKTYARRPKKAVAGA
jgi:CHAD domain-containing protein